MGIITSIERSIKLVALTCNCTIWLYSCLLVFCFYFIIQPVLVLDSSNCSNVAYVFFGECDNSSNIDGNIHLRSRLPKVWMDPVNVIVFRSFCNANILQYQYSLVIFISFLVLVIWYLINDIIVLVSIANWIKMIFCIQVLQTENYFWRYQCLSAITRTEIDRKVWIPTYNCLR